MSRARFDLFASIALFGWLLCGGSGAQTPLFEGFAFPWGVPPGRYAPGATRQVVEPSPGGSWSMLVAREARVDLLAENVMTWTAQGRSVLGIKASPPSASPTGGGAVLSGATFPEGTWCWHVSASAREDHLALNGVVNGFYCETAPGDLVGFELRSRIQGTIGHQRGVLDAVAYQGGVLQWRESAVIPFDPSDGRFYTFAFQRGIDRVDYLIEGHPVLTVLGSQKWLPSGPGAFLVRNGAGDPAWAGQPPTRDTFLGVDWAAWTPVAFAVDTDRLGIAAGGLARFELAGGAALAGRGYLVAISLLEPSRGTPLWWGTLPLDVDQLGLSLTLLGVAPNPLFVGFLGTLDASGLARPSFHLPAGVGVGLAGQVFRFAALSADTGRPFVTTPVSIRILP